MADADIMRIPAGRSGSALHIAVIVAVIVVAYIPSFKAPFLLDDNHVILENPDVRGIRPMSNIWRSQPARPLVYTSFAVDFRLFKREPGGYHIQNLAAHLLASILLYIFVRRLLRKEREESDLSAWTAFFAALAFGIHPMNTEAVTYLSGRFTVFAGLFIMLSVYAFSIAVESQKMRWPMIAVSVTSFALAFLSKEDGFVTPLLIVFYLLGTRAKKKKDRLLVLPFLLILAAGLAYRYLSLDRLGNIVTPHPHSVYLATESVVFFKYLSRFILPVHLSFLPEVDPVSMLSLKFAAAAAGILLILLSGLPDRWRSFRSFGIIWMFVALAPSSSLVPLEDFMAEHRFYTASAGALIAVAMILYRVLEGGSRQVRLKFLACGIIAACIFSGLTLRRNVIYSDESGLLRDAISRNPARAGLFSDLGYFYHLKGKDEKAKTFLAQAIRLDPEHFRALNNMGNVYDAMGETESAVEYYRRAAAIAANPGKMYTNIGMVYLRKKEYKNAMYWLREGVRYEPFIGETHYGLGLALAGVKEYPEAVREIEKGISLSGPRADMFFELGRVCLAAGDQVEAKRSFIRALEIEPGFAPARASLQQLQFIEQALRFEGESNEKH